ncbi:SPOR domain-containing protein [Acinetobacter sp. ANC 4633]|uniref:SPOR domain-containing protein n=1 Tax=Acinetobacter sp. ANC 4633 TaxID=2529845 RepID=UPI00103B4FE5|nr:SPOR domain-containing protein [Acinetobacter sp. ANC 4633]TCB26312.1 SPOR domain-containing protein [Acinetobacter sp. ANC 4633]
MSMNNKQRWMGGVVLLGGGVLLAALLVKGTQELKHKATPSAQTTIAQQQKTTQKTGNMQPLQPLTVDVETEKRLLEEQKRSRERAVAEQEARTQQYLQQQQQAEADAARKAAEEYAEINKRRTGQGDSDNIPPEVKPDSKNKAVDQQHQVDSTAKKKLADDETAKHQAAVDAKKKANAEAKKQADLEAKKQVEREARKKAEADEQKKADEEAHRRAVAKKKAELEAQKKADAEEKRQADAEEKRRADAAEVKHKKALEAKHKAALDAKKKADDDQDTEIKKKDKKADADKARDLLEGKKKWMVQVALAANQANADATVSRLRAKGYKVVTSQTSKGIRVMVGPAKDRETADTARRKIQADSSLGMKSAWIIDWVPLDQR